jgi:hypothetical protein
MRGNSVIQAEFRRYFRERAASDLAGYRRGAVTAGEYQLSACFAGIAEYSLEVRRRDWTPRPPDRRARRVLKPFFGGLRWSLSLS